MARRRSLPSSCRRRIVDETARTHVRAGRCACRPDVLALGVERAAHLEHAGRGSTSTMLNRAFEMRGIVAAAAAKLQQRVRGFRSPRGGCGDRSRPLPRSRQAPTSAATNPPARYRASVCASSALPPPGSAGDRTCPFITELVMRNGLQIFSALAIESTGSRVAQPPPVQAEAREVLAQTVRVVRRGLSRARRGEQPPARRRTASATRGTRGSLPRAEPDRTDRWRRACSAASTARADPPAARRRRVAPGGAQPLDLLVHHVAR